MTKWKTGEVVEVIANKGTARVRFPDADGVISKPLPVLQNATGKDKTYWLPDPGEQVVCLMDESLTEGAILGAIYSEKDPVPVSDRLKRVIKFSDGTIVQYDRGSKELLIKCSGKVIIEGSEVTLKAPNVIINGNLSATGGNISLN